MSVHDRDKLFGVKNHDLDTAKMRNHEPTRPGHGTNVARDLIYSPIMPDRDPPRSGISPAF